MKKVISFILVSCMLQGVTTAFADTDLNTDSASDIINTEVLTDENLLYKAMQENRGFSLFGLGDDGEYEITDDFDVVMGFDMSYSMYEYDINGDKLWLDSFKAIEEQAPDNTRYAVLSSNIDSFTSNLETAINEVQNENYTGTNDVTSMLDESLNIFDEASIDRNKVVIIAAHEVSDADELEETLDMLRDYGVMPFVFVLNTSTDNDLDIDGVYQCATDLDLRLALSDLYLAFSEFDMATATIQTYAESDSSETVSTLKSDFISRHQFQYETSESDGLKMASILNMYKCVPMKATIKNTLNKNYDLLNDFTPEEREYFLEANNIALGSMPEEFVGVWNQIFADIPDDKKVFISDKTEIESVIIKNMKRRFPIMVQLNINESNYIWEIATEYNSSANKVILSDGSNADISAIEQVFNTYEYILNTVYSATNLYDTVDWQNGLVTIDTIYPNDYNLVVEGDNATVRRHQLPEDIDVGGIEYIANGKNLHITITEERNFVVESLATFDAGFPDVYGATKGYRIIFYNNVNSSCWYADYLFKATNIGMVSGDGNGNFDPDANITYSAFFRMLFDAVYVDYSDIEGGPIDNEDKETYWAYNYLKKAEQLGLLDYDFSNMNWAEIQTYGDTNNVIRGQAAQWICDLLLDNQDAVNAPTLLYDYTDITNYRSEELEKYKDISVGDTYYETIKQLYMNGIMNGYEDKTIRPNENLTRAEICVLIVKCLFDMDENIPVIEANIEENIEPTPEPVQIEVDTREKIIDDIVFNAENVAVYEITFDGFAEENHKYVIQTTGDLTASKLSATLDGAGDIEPREGSDDENNKLLKHVIYSFNGEKEKTYTLTIKRDGTDSIGLKIVDMNIPQSLAFVPQTGGRYIYSNCQESIGEYDIVDSSVPSLLFSQEGLTTGKYTIMMEHINNVPLSDIYVNVLFYDKNSNSKITITKYGNVTFNFDMNINHAGIPAYSSFMGLDVARVRTLVPDSVYDSDQRIIRKQNIGEVISNPTHEFKDGSAYWLSDFFNQNDKYPRLNTKDYIYTMLEFEVISTEGIACSIAAYKNEDVHDNFENYITYDEMVSKSPYPEWGSDCYKGIAEFMPETVAELEFIIDNDSVGRTQKITTSNPFGESGYITVDRWKTHQNPQADKFNPDHNVTSDIIPLIYNDPFNGKLYFDTEHKKNGIDLLAPAEVIVEDNGEKRYSSNLEYACNLANFSVRETYKIKAQNITGFQRTLCYQIETGSNMFVSVRDSQGNYIPFTIDELDEQVDAICTGEVAGNDREKFHPITNGKIRVELPESQNDLTQIKLDVKAHCTEEFYIDITLSGANNGGIYNKVFFE